MSHFAPLMERIAPASGIAMCHVGCCEHGQQEELSTPSVAAHASLYLAAVLDWFTRRVLAWRVSITLEADFRIEAVEEALARHGTPEIFNMEHGRATGSSGHATSGQPVHLDRLHQGGKHPLWLAVTHKCQEVMLRCGLLRRDLRGGRSLAR